MSSRQKKYPNTDTFEYYNANQKGKLTTDCMARAIDGTQEYENDGYCVSWAYHPDDGLEVLYSMK